MAKKQIKKNISKKEIIKVNDSVNEKDEMFRLIKILIIILVIFLAFYLITKLIQNNKKSSVNTDEEAIAGEIQYEYILAGSVFNQKDKEYYVYIEDLDDMMSGLHTSIINSYEELEDTLPIYYVDLKNTFNKSYLSTESNKKASKATELKLQGGTLIKIKNGKNVLYIEGNEISSHFRNLINKAKED